MLRSMYIASTGMRAQDLNVSVIANNLANVNTSGFKRSRADFEDLLYQNLKLQGTISNSGGLGWPMGGASGEALDRF